MGNPHCRGKACPASDGSTARAGPADNDTISLVVTTGRLFLRCTWPRFVLQTHARASAILVDELDTSASQNFFNFSKRLRVSRISAYLNIINRVSVKPGSFGQFPYGPI